MFSVIPPINQPKNDLGKIFFDIFQPLKTYPPITQITADFLRELLLVNLRHPRNRRVAIVCINLRIEFCTWFM